MRDNIDVHDEGDIDRLAWKIFPARCVMGIQEASCCNLDGEQVAFCNFDVVNFAMPFWKVCIGLSLSQL